MRWLQRYLLLGLLAMLIIWQGSDAFAKYLPPLPFLSNRQQLTIQPCNISQTVILPNDLPQLMDGVVIVQNRDHIGSGVIISTNGYILTAAHLVQNQRSAAIYLNSGDTIRGDIVRVDARKDIALIKVEDKHYRCMNVSNIVPPLGSRIFTIGFLPERNAGFVIEEGRIQRHRYLWSKQSSYLQTSLDLKPGSSGGPLLNQRGEVAGIISWKSKNKNGTASLFSLPVSVAIRALNIRWATPSK